MQFTLMRDVFMSVALEDIPACRHVLRILTGIDTLEVKKVKTKYTVSKIHSGGARLAVREYDSGIDKDT